MPVKNILYIHSSSDLYGADRSLLRTIKSLDKSKFKAIVCLPYHGPLADELTKEGIKTYTFELSVLRRQFFTPVGIFLFPVKLLMSSLKIRKIIRQEKIDLVHSNTAAVFSGGIAAKLSGKPHIQHVREIILEPVAVKKMISFFAKYFATVIVPVSKSTADNLIEDQPSIKPKIRVIHNGLEIDKFTNGDRESVRQSLGIQNDEFLIGMIGRVSHWKGQDLFLDIAKKVFAKNKKAKFVAVGSPFLGQEFRMDDFKKAVSESQLGSHFLVEEFRTDIPNLLSAFDVFIMPSTLPDPFPTTVLEAMAAGKAIVGNAHGGILQMIENSISGILNSPNSSDELSESILELLQNSEKRLDFGKKAQQRIMELFTVEIYQKNITSLYQDLLPETI